MANRSKAKGDRAELEVQGILRDLLGVPARRALGAGRADDMGDISGVLDTVIQVVARKDIARAVREKVPDAERQRVIAGVPFAAVFVRTPGGGYFVAQSPEQWSTMWREAIH